MKLLLCTLFTCGFLVPIRAFDYNWSPSLYSGTHHKGLMIGGISCAGAGAVLAMGGLVFYGSNSSSRGSNSASHSSGYSENRRKSSIAAMESGLGLIVVGCTLMAIDAAHHNRRKKWWAITAPKPNEIGMAWNIY